MSCRTLKSPFKWRCRYRCVVLLDCDYRIDLLVGGDLIVEIKSVEMLLPIHHAQILTYMRIAKIPIGLLINFNVTKLKSGVKRFVL